MVKRVFAIIGIILGSVAVLAGSIVGIMAAMGKFKAPVVYPESLVFEQPSLLVDSEDESLSFEVGTKKIYSFVLTGTSSKNYDVNRPTCYISFIQGKDIITLCNKEGEPLAASSGNKYKVNCNEPIYYFVNSTTGDEPIQKAGTVKLEATNERGTIGSNELTISIDSAIKTIFVDTSNENNSPLQNEQLDPTSTTEKASQTISLSVGGKFYLDYVISPDNSLKPITEKEAKEIELYYVGNEEYHIVNSETAVSDMLKDFIKFDNDLGKYYFTSATPGKYQFKIAYFPTYNAKDKFEAEEGNASLTGYYRVQEMRYTNLIVDVANTSVTGVELTTNGVKLNLYLQDSNYVTLNAEDLIEGKQNNDLGLTYVPADMQTSIRYNEAIFLGNDIVNLYEDVTLVSDEEVPSYINYTLNSRITKTNIGEFNLEILDGTGTTLTLKSSFNGKVLDFGTSDTPRIVITEIKSGETTYSTSGLIVVEGVKNSNSEEHTYTLKLLSAGTYLDFYIDTTTSLTKWQDYEAKVENKEELTGKKRTWNIIAKSQPEEKLTLGVLVVNIDGEYFFSTADTSVDEFELEQDAIEFKNDKQHKLEISFNPDGSINKSAENYEIDVDDVFKFPENASYQAGILLTKKLESEDAKYSISVVDEIVYEIDGEKYVPVGCITESGEGENLVRTFVNSVRVNEIIPTLSTSVYVAQLKTAYGVDAVEYISNILNGKEQLSQEAIIKFFKTSSITITTEYNIASLANATGGFNESIIDVVYNQQEVDENDNICYVQGKTYSITITMKEDTTANARANVFTYIKDLLSTQNVALSDLFGFSRSNITKGEVTIQEIEYEGLKYNQITINFTVVDTLPNDLDTIRLEFAYGDTTIAFNPIRILSNKPTAIYYNYKDNESNEQSVALYETWEEAKNATNKFVVGVSYDGGYVYNWSYRDKNNTTHSQSGFKLTNSSPFSIGPDYATGGDKLFYSALTTTGNTSDTMKFVANTVDVDTEYTVSFLSKDEVILVVEVENLVKRYIAIEISPSNFAFTKPGEENVGVTEYKLPEDTYYYSSDAGTVKLPSYITLKNIKAIGYNESLIFDKEDDNYILYYKSKDADGENVKVKVLTASKASGNWIFTRQTDKVSTLKLSITIGCPTNDDITFDLNFKPNTSINVNTSAGWKELTFYQGTKVKLYEQFKDDTTTYETSKAVFKIKDSNASVTVALYKKSNDKEGSTSNENVFDSAGTTGTYTPYKTFSDDCAEYILVFSKGGEVLVSYTLNVVPNAVINVTNQQFVENKAGQAFFTAYAYDTTSTIFGETCGAYPILKLDESGQPTGDFAIYASEITTGFTLSSDKETGSLITTGGNQISTGALAEIGAYQTENVTISYNEKAVLTIAETGIKLANNLFINGVQHTANEIEITIHNPFVVTFGNSKVEILSGVIASIKPQISVKPDFKDVVTLPTENSIVVSVVSVKDKNQNSYTLDDGKITTHISNDTPISLQFNITITGFGEYTITKENYFTLTPYLPLTGDAGVVYSEKEYDLIAHIFDLAEIPTEITNITLTDNGLLDENGNEISKDLYFNNLDLGASLISNSEIGAKIKALNGNEVKVKLMFEITYKDAVGAYSYPHTLLIKNRDNANETYPYSDIKIAGSSIDLVKYGTADEIVTLAVGENYEPVIFNQTIDLSTSWYALKRVNIQEVNDGDTKIDSIEIYAISANNETLKNYVNNGFISINKPKITFNSSTDRGPVAMGYIQFKYTTTNGAYGFYNVKLFNQLGSNSGSNQYNNISVNSNQNISVSPVSEIVKDGDGNTTSETYTRFNFNLNATTNNYNVFEQVVTVANGNETVNNTKIGTELDYLTNLNIKEFNSSLISMYLIGVDSPINIEEKEDPTTKVKELYVGDESLGFTYFEKLDGKTLPQLSNYVTLTIALVYKGNASQFCFGTLTVYVQPKASEQIDTTLLKPNTSSQWNDKVDYYSFNGTDYSIIESKPEEWAEDYTTYYVLSTDGEILTHSAEYNSGHYTQVITNKTTTYPAPFANVISISGVDNYNFEKTVSKGESDATTLSFNKYVSADYTFSVTYHIDTDRDDTADLDVIIDFTYEAFNLDKSLKEIEVGKFNGSGFNNFYGLSDLISSSSTGEYDAYDLDNKTISVSINDVSTESFKNGLNIDGNPIDKEWEIANGGKVVLNTEASARGFTFSQTDKSYIVEITITFDACVNSQNVKETKTIEVTVLPGIYVDNSQPISATGNEDYLTSNGNTLTFDIDLETGYTKYTASGLTIYVADSVTSALTFGYTPTSYTVGTETYSAFYVNSIGATELNEDDLSGEINSSNNVINFPHLPQAKGIEMTLQFLNTDNTAGTMQMASQSADVKLATTINIKVSLQQTYSGLQAVYLVSGAEHENVVAGKWGTGDAYTTLFDQISGYDASIKDLANNTSILNQYRLVLLGLDKDGDNKPDELPQQSLTSMGFGTSTNPNFLTYTYPTGTRFVNDGANDVLEFYKSDEISTYPTELTLQMTNTAGMPNAYYTFFFMPDASSTDGMNINTSNSSIATVGNNYITYLVDTLTKTDEDTSYKQIELDENIFANSLDTDNTTFYITNLKVVIDGDTTETSSYAYTFTKGGTEYKVTRSEIDGTGIQYTIPIKYSYVNASNITTDEIYTLTITLSENEELKVALLSERDAIFNKMQVTFTAFGDTSKICENFNMFFYNYSESSEVNGEVGATNLFDIKSKIKLTSNYGAGEEFKYRLANKEEDNIKPYINAYNDEDGSIVTYHVSSDTLLPLVFNVVDVIEPCSAYSSDSHTTPCTNCKEIIVTTIQFNLTVKRNLILKVNNEELPEGNAYFKTEYKLQNAKLSDIEGTTEKGFPLTQSLIYEETTNENLGLSLFKTNNSGTSSNIGLSSVTIELIDGLGVVEYNDATRTLTFNKDITTFDDDEFIELKIIVDTASDTPYVVYWRIYLTGLETVQYVDQALGSSKIMNNGGGGFASGDSVILFNDPEFAEDSLETNISMDKDYGNTQIEITANVSYIIHPWSSEITYVQNVETMFEEGSPYYSDIVPLGEIPTNTEFLSIDLPVVPQTGTNEFHLVTYKIELDYLGIKDSTRKYQSTYYVTYKVFNDQQMVANPTKTTVTVNSSSTGEIDLFNFYESYTDASSVEQFKIVPNGTGGKVLIYGGENYTWNPTVGFYVKNDYSTVTTFTSETDAIKLDKADDKFDAIFGTVLGTTFTEGTEETDKIEGLTKSSVSFANNIFTAQFKDIDTFILTMKDIKAVCLSNMDGLAIEDVSEIYYQLQLDSLTGTYSINLGKPYSKTNFVDSNKIDITSTKLFNNKLTATLGLYSTEDIYSTDITVKPDEVISAANPKALNEIFSATQLGLANVNFEEYEIIGVFDDKSDTNTTENKDDISTIKGYIDSKVYNWIKIGVNINSTTTNIVSDVTKVSDFTTISGDSMQGNYSLYRIIYTLSGGTLYNLTAPYYAIGSNTGAITLIDYVNAYNANSFQVSYTYGATNQTMDCTNIIKEYTGAMVCATGTPTSILVNKKKLDDATNEGGTNEDGTTILRVIDAYDNTNKLMYLSRELIDHKNNNKEDVYISKDYTAEWNHDNDDNTPALEFKFTVHWMLPSIVLPSYEIDEDDSTTAFVVEFDETAEYQTLDLTGLFTCYSGRQNFVNTSSVNLNVAEKLTTVTTDSGSSSSTSYGSEYLSDTNTLSIKTDTIKNNAADLEITYTAKWDHDDNTNTPELTFAFTVIWKLVTVNYPQGSSVFEVEYDNSLESMALDLEGKFTCGQNANKSTDSLTITEKGTSYGSSYADGELSISKATLDNNIECDKKYLEIVYSASWDEDRNSTTHNIHLNL